MAKLAVKRKSEWVNWSREMRIFLNGEKIGVIANGDSKEFEIPDGKYILKAKMNWYSSNEHSFVVSNNETHVTLLSAYKYSNIVIAFEFWIILAHFSIKYLYGYNNIIWLATPFFLYSLSYSTIGYNRYLVLKEDKLSLSF
jgi:hypothetical protein